MAPRNSSGKRIHPVRDFSADNKWACHDKQSMYLEFVQKNFRSTYQIPDSEKIRPRAEISKTTWMSLSRISLFKRVPFYYYYCQHYACHIRQRAAWAWALITQNIPEGRNPRKQRKPMHKVYMPYSMSTSSYALSTILRCLNTVIRHIVGGIIKNILSSLEHDNAKLRYLIIIAICRT